MVLDLAKPAVLEAAQHRLLVLHDAARLDILLQALPVLSTAVTHETVHNGPLDDGRVSRPLVPAAARHTHVVNMTL